MLRNYYNPPPITKSPSLALLLALTLGPIGMFYATITGAVIMLVVNIVFGILTYGLAIIVLWPLGARIAYMVVRNKNRLLERRPSIFLEARSNRMISKLRLIEPFRNLRTDETESKLVRLKNLRDKDLISEDDFNEKKKQILEKF